MRCEVTRGIARAVLLGAVTLWGACGTVVPPDDASVDDSDPTDAHTDLDPADLETAVRARAEALGLTPWFAAPVGADPGLVELGRQLFGEKLLFGGRAEARSMRSCSSCHLAFGPHGRDLAFRADATGWLYGRNVRSLVDAGRPEVRAWFWDARVRVADAGRIHSPLEALLPDETDPLVVALVEGGTHVGTVFRPGEPKGPAGETYDDDPAGRMAFIAERILAIPAYQDAFAAAFPGTPLEEVGYVHIARAIAAYLRSDFTSRGTRWDRWLEGDPEALSVSEKRGAALFLQEGGCVACHAGSGFSDGRVHVLAVPQIGPGIGPDAPLDRGAALWSGQEADAFAFLTPRLRNLGATRPYMHDGVYDDLEKVLRHHADPLGALASFRQEDVKLAYRAEQGPAGFTFEIVKYALAWPDPSDAVATLGPRLDARLSGRPTLTEDEIQWLVDFLGALDEPDPARRAQGMVAPGLSGTYPEHW